MTRTDTDGVARRDDSATPRAANVAVALADVGSGGAVCAARTGSSGAATYHTGSPRTQTRLVVFSLSASPAAVDDTDARHDASVVAHSHDKLVRDLYAAMDRRDGRALAAALQPDTRWVIAGNGKLAGTYVGPDAIFEFWRRVARETRGGLRLTLRDVLANDRRAVALVDVVGTRGDRTLHASQIVVFELAGGKLHEARFVYEDQATYDTFWS